MIYFFLFSFVVLGICLLYHFLTRKYLNPYKLTMCFGKKGCGKTTLLTKLALKAQRRGQTVYSTEPIPGTYLIHPRDIGYIQLEPNSLLLIDEVGLIWHCRKHKEFPDEVRAWFKLQRHYKVSVVMFSQTWDVDKGLRDLCDNLMLIENKFRVFSYGKRILKRMVLNKSTAEAPSKLDEDLVFDSFLFFWCGSRTFTFIPKYTKYFNSFEVPELPVVDLPYSEALQDEKKFDKIKNKIKGRRLLKRKCG